MAENGKIGLGCGLLGQYIIVTHSEPQGATE